MIPPPEHACCGTPCFFEGSADKEHPCWGYITCVDADWNEETNEEYRFGACEGHSDMYPSHDTSKYVRYSVLRR